MSMFCFQCEQVVGGKACIKSGACGKIPVVSNGQDELTAALIGLSRAACCKGTKETDEMVMRGLFATVTNVNFDENEIADMTKEANELSKALGGTGVTPEINLWEGDEDIVSLRSLLIIGLRGMAAYAWHALVLGKNDSEVTNWFYKGLKAAAEDHSVDEWLGLLMEFGQINLKCMALLDEANTGTYGHPEPTKVSTTIEKGPFIIVTGHDLKDLKELLEQSEGKGVNIYTHSEMLPAHGYPELKKYSHLKGNYGTAWQNQKKEFKDIPGALLFTTNCLMPPMPSYADNIYLANMVAFPGIKKVDETDGVKDFAPMIEKAIELGGWDEDKTFTGINGGKDLLTGFARNTVLNVAGTIVDAVKAGDISHFFLVGGCDGAKPGRNYYTDFVAKSPKDSIILTLACGKFRFNDMDLGEIGGLPRIMDMGQCNDAYSAIKVALALAEAFECGVNDLPLTMVLSWYEQKAVCILLTLLSLGIKGIYLGPTLPAFISPNVLQILVDMFDIRPTGDAEEDLKTILG